MGVEWKWRKRKRAVERNKNPSSVPGTPLAWRGQAAGHDTTREGGAEGASRRGRCVGVRKVRPQEHPASSQPHAANAACS